VLTRGNSDPTGARRSFEVPKSSPGAESRRTR
jgi:hypothetical protein